MTALGFKNFQVVVGNLELWFNSRILLDLIYEWKHEPSVLCLYSSMTNTTHIFIFMLTLGFLFCNKLTLSPVQSLSPGVG